MSVIGARKINSIRKIAIIVITMLSVGVAGGMGTVFGQPAHAAQRALPMEVAAKLRDMEGFCRQVGGRPAGTSHVIQTDFNRDGITDYVIDENRYSCPPGLNPFTGNAGGTVYAYVSSARGRAKLVFETGSYKTRIAASSNPSTIFVSVSGQACGAKPSHSRAAEASCERPLVWNALKQVVELGRSGEFGRSAAIRPTGSAIRTQTPTPQIAGQLAKLLVGTWEVTLVGTEADPGRCVSRPGHYENTIVKFQSGGQWKFFHQEGDSVGSWRVSGQTVAIKIGHDTGTYTAKIISPDHLLLSLPGSETERHRRCSW